MKRSWTCNLTTAVYFLSQVFTSIPTFTLCIFLTNDSPIVGYRPTIVPSIPFVRLDPACGFTNLSDSLIWILPLTLFCSHGLKCTYDTFFPSVDFFRNSIFAFYFQRCRTSFALVLIHLFFLLSRFTFSVGLSIALTFLFVIFYFVNLPRLWVIASFDGNSWPRRADVRLGTV